MHRSITGTFGHLISFPVMLLHIITTRLFLECHQSNITCQEVSTTPVKHEPGLTCTECKRQPSGKLLPITPYSTKEKFPSASASAPKFQVVSFYCTPFESAPWRVERNSRKSCTPVETARFRTWKKKSSVLQFEEKYSRLGNLFCTCEKKTVKT